MASVNAREIIYAQSISSSVTGVLNSDGANLGKLSLLTKDIDFIGQILVTGSSVATKEITAITAVADVAGSLDGTYFIIYDDVGSVAFWIDVDNSGTTIPAGASAADRAVEITTITTGMAIGAVGTAVYNAVIGDSKFEAGSDDTAGNITVQSTTTGLRTDASDGDTGFTITVNTQGNEAPSYAAKIQHSHDGSNWYDLLSFSAVTGDVAEIVQVDNTTVHVLQFVRAVLTKTAGDATFAIDLLYDRRS